MIACAFADLVGTLLDLFPIRLSSLLSRQVETDRHLSDLLKRFNSSSLGIMDPIQLVKRAIPENLPIKVTEILPRLKDGGAFVKFEYDTGLNVSEIEGKSNDGNLTPFVVADCGNSKAAEQA